MKTKVLKHYLRQLYTGLMKIKNDKEFMLKSGFYEIDKDLGIVPVILKEDPREVKERKLNIIRHKVEYFFGNMPNLFKQKQINHLY